METTNPMPTTETTKTAPKHPMAYDAEGNPLDVPAEATAWRVRKMAARAGRPKVVFDAETGRQLEVPLTATVHDLADVVGVSGRYRLEAVNSEGRLIDGCVAVMEVACDDEAPQTSPMMDSSDALPHLVALIGDLVKANTQAMQTMVSAFGPVKPARQQPMTIEIPSGAAADNSQGNEVVQQISGVLQQMMTMVGAQKAAATAAGGKA